MSDAIVWNGDAASSCSFGAPEPLSGIGLDSVSHWGSALVPGSLTLLFGAWPEGNEDVFQTSRPGRGTSFEPAVLLPGINTASNDGTPFLSADSLSIYFYSTRAGGEGDRDLYVATRSSISNAFANTERLANVNSSGMDHLPRLPNERTLVFTSMRSGGQGSADLWVATRDDPTLDFEAPVPLEGINTGADEEAGQLSADQRTLVFGSNRNGGVGGHDLWFATRSSASSPFASPVNLTGLNSADEEVNVLMSDDGEEIFFSSNRVDGTTQQLWRATRNCDL
jgi:Tol biopolymer transport system component